MADSRAGWAERSARLAHERAVALRDRPRKGKRPELVAVANAEMDERRDLPGTSRAANETGDDQVVRAAVNDLQHRLLMMDAQTDVFGLALERLLTAAGADRVCAFMTTTHKDGRAEYALHAEAFVSPELSLAHTGAEAPQAFDDTVPARYERLSAGEAFGSRTEFLARRAARRLAEQGVEAVLVLPLFVGGALSGFLRLDRCDHARLWSETETEILISAAGSISAAIERQKIVAELVQRSHEMAALLATSRSITSSIDYDVVLREVACAAAEALGCPESAIWEYSGRSDIAVYRVLYQRKPQPGAADAILGTTYYASDYPGGMQAVRDGAVAQQSYSDDDLSEADRARMTQRGERTWLSVPLVYSREVLGMMILTETEQERRFTPDEVRMARLIGEQAAAALHNARLHRREEDQHRWLAALAEATRVIASRLDRVELLQDVARLATEALLVDDAIVYEWDTHSSAFIHRASEGAAPESTPGRVDAGIAETLRNGELVVQRREDGTLSAHAAARMAAAGEYAIVWVPFRMNDETLGVMRLAEHSRQRRLGDDELSFARALGEHAAIALNNAHLYAQIEDQAMKDGLTGLANHRRFYDRLAEEMDRGRRYGTPVALLMLDIDDFKRLNDTYGHPAGDEVLRLIGRLMNEGLRSGGDLAARYGGEEFCVILPNTAALPDSTDSAKTRGHDEGAAALAERLRRCIAAREFPVGPDGATAHVTVSVGVASFPATAGQMDELVAHADAALYAAKRSGKDSVGVY